MNALTKPMAFAVLLLLCGAGGRAQERTGKSGDQNAGLVYGQDYMFVVSAPEGWVLDDRSGLSQGAQVVFYPTGSSWGGGSTVMYVSVYRKRDVKTETLGTVISGDIAEFKKNSAKLSVVEAAPLPTRNKRMATVRYFSSDSFGNSEAVAYLDEGKVVIMFVSTARTKKEFDEILHAFAELVGSYMFLGDKVVAQPK